MHLFWLVLVMSSIAVAPAAGQWQRPPAAWSTTETWGGDTATRADNTQTFAARPRSLEWLVLGGALGGAVGLVSGAFVGAVAGDVLSRGGCYSECGFGWMILGAYAGEIVGIATGVHIANAGRGSYPLALLTSTGAGLVAAVAVVGTVGDNYALLIPVVQIAAVIAVERRTTRASQPVSTPAP